MTAPALLHGVCSEPAPAHLAPAALSALPVPDWARAQPRPLPCHEHDADLWFAEQARHLEQAKAFCQQCPLKASCLAGALERAEPWGVWGGEIFVAGQVVAVKRGRGRPRKVTEDAA